MKASEKNPGTTREHPCSGTAQKTEVSHQELRGSASTKISGRLIQRNGKTEIYVVCNFFREEAELPAGLIPEGARLLLGNYEADTKKPQEEELQTGGKGLCAAAAGKRLRPYECFIALAEG